MVAAMTEQERELSNKGWEPNLDIDQEAADIMAVASGRKL